MLHVAGGVDYTQHSWGTYLYKGEREKDIGREIEGKRGRKRTVEKKIQLIITGGTDYTEHSWGCTPSDIDKYSPTIPQIVFLGLLMLEFEILLVYLRSYRQN